MPLPLIPIIAGAVALGAAGKGVHSLVTAKDTNDRANSVNREASSISNDAKKSAEYARTTSGRSLEVLGKTKLGVLDGSVAGFVGAFTKIKNVDFQHSAGMGELSKFRLDKQELDNLREMSGFAASALGGGAGGLAGGALTAFGAYSATAAFGAASTGTAIATLSGAAATNATLAFLGGGTLAAGGLGVAGGMAVLGGLVAGPAILITGLFAEKNANENLDNAYSNRAEAKKYAEELKLVETMCNGIKSRARLFTDLFKKLDEIFTPLVAELKNIVNNSGEDYSKYSDDQQKTVAASAALAKAIKTALDTPILTKEGTVTEESKTVADDLNKTLAAYQPA